MNEIQPILPDEVMDNKIYIIRNREVMLDRDLAKLYGVETRVLRKRVNLQRNRFPDDFLFTLALEEKNTLISQFGSLGWAGVNYLPMAFTEQGVAMLSVILDSQHAVMVSIQIVRLFTRLNNQQDTPERLPKKLELLEKKNVEQDQRILVIIEYLKQLEKSAQLELQQPRKVIRGYRQDKM